MTLLLLLPLSAQAQGDTCFDASPSPAADIGEVEVVDATEGDAPDAPGAFTSVITPKRFDQRTKSTPELLSESVGVDVTSLGGEGQLSKVSIRGSSAEQVAVFLDGVRINTALTGAVDFATIPVDAIERIEVIRGAASTRFGTDAIGGVINIVTKSADAKRSIDLKLTGASFQTLKTSASWSEPLKKGSLVVAHTHRSTGGDFPFQSAGITLAGSNVADPQTYHRLHNRSIAEDWLLKGTVDLSDELHLSLLNDFFWTTRQVPGLEIETTQLYPANPLEANEEIFRDTASIMLSDDAFLLPDLSLEAGASLLFHQSHFTDPSPALGDPIDVTSLTLTPGAHLLLLHDAEVGPVALTSLLRTQYRYDTSDDSSPLAGAALMGSHDRHTISLFLEEDVGFFERRLRLIPSGRVERASDRTTRASWRVGLSAQPWSWLELKTNVGTAFRYPTFNELYFPDQGYLRGNPDLADERSFGLDAGIVLHPPRSRIEIAYYRNDIENQILFVPISATTIQPINTGKANLQGVEVSAACDPVRWLHADANYTWLDATFQSNGLRLPGRPEHKVNARISGTYKWATLFTELQYISAFPINAMNTVQLTGHTSGDVGATIRFAKHFFATFEVKDVTNVQIYDARGFPLPRRSYWMTVGAQTSANRDT